MTFGDSGPDRSGRSADLDVDLVDPVGIERPDVDVTPDVVVVDDLPRKRIFNLDFIDSSDMAAVADAILSGAEPRHPGQLPVVVTPNVDIVVQMNERPDSVETGVLLGAQFCLPDGQPIVASSRLLDRPLATRLAGRLLFAEIWPRLTDHAIPVTVVASSEAIRDGLLAENPNANIVVAPFFERDDAETIDRLATTIVDDARRLGTRFVLSGVGFPKDQLIADRIIHHWPVDGGRCPTMMGLGASFAFHLGLVEKSPEWMQRAGLEWFHRFLQEPKRLFHRYFVRDMQFIPLVVDEWRQGQRKSGK